MFAILHFSKNNKEGQTMQIVALSIREVIEQVTSLGVSLVLGSSWLTHKEDFFMIDNLTKKQLERAITMSIVDFFLELIVMIGFSRMVLKVWGLTPLDLAQAFCAAIGRLEFFGLVAGCTALILACLQYHFGSDYYFQFYWLAEGMRNNPEFCENLQAVGESCYQMSYA